MKAFHPANLIAPLLVVFLNVGPAHAAEAPAPAAKPNILLIYADDIGCGDVGCYGATAVKTPHVDRLAKEGLRFTSGYSAASTCTPSRYALMTGEYAFRKKGTGILPGDAAMIVPTDRATLPSILQKAGYATGIVGKWHLGLGEGGDVIKWNGEIKPGPRETGFAESFIMAATGDRAPCVFIENQRIVGLDPSDPIQVSYGKPFPGEPTGVSERDHLKMDWAYGHNDAVVNGIGRIGFMKGGQSARWKDEDMADTFTRKGVAFIERNKDKPFFLYFATHDIHVPRVPHARFVGKTTMGPRGDAIVQFDACVGELLGTLDRLKLTDNTLVILTSDNGPVLNDGYKDGAVEKLGNHKPAGPFRGGKSTIWEGGTRVPFVVRWPARVKPGVSDAVVSQVDFCASFAALTGQALAPDDAPDSFNVLPALLGESPQGREHLLEHSGQVAIRKGQWKLIPGAPGGSKPDPAKRAAKADALYDLDKDPAESTNVAGQHPEVLEQLSRTLETLRAQGRSRPSVAQVFPTTAPLPGAPRTTAVHAAPAAPLLKADPFKHYLERFNADDNELYANAFPNAKAWEFLESNIPLFQCPDEDLERTYYFRWWTYRKHIKQTPDGWVITEFLPKVSWSAKHNTISCPAGHHFYEGRWLADAKYLDNYAAFWFRKGGNPRQYSFWAADAIYACYLAKGNKALVTDLLDDLVKNYDGWEQNRLTPDGLFWQIDDRDGMEVSIGKSGKRATINSYMFGDATAIARIAELAGRKELAVAYRAKAERLRQLVQTKLWDPEAKFFKTLPQSRHELTTPKNSQDGSVPKLHWMDADHRGTFEWVQYIFDKPRAFDSTEVYWAEGGPALGAPASWRVLARKGAEWLPVKNRGNYGVAMDTFNKVAFEPVETDAIRLEVQSAKNKSGGILEWRALGSGKNHAPDGKISKSFDIRMGRNNSVAALNDGEGASKEAGLVDVRELHGFTPWYFNLPEAGNGYEVAWKQLMDPNGFLAPFGPTTAEQRHPGFQISYEGHGCQWNGPSWPFATAVTLTAMANVLNNYHQDAISKDDYLKSLQIYAQSHRRKLADGRVGSWIDENIDPFTGEWIARKRCEEHNAELVKKGQADKVLLERGKDYNHSSYCDLVITGLVGLRPRADNVVEVHPLVPDGKWDWFCLDRVSYHGRTLTIFWDKTGTKYNKGKGLRVFADGREIAHSETLGRVTASLAD